MGSPDRAILLKSPTAWGRPTSWWYWSESESRLITSWSSTSHSWHHIWHTPLQFGSLAYHRTTLRHSSNLHQDHWPYYQPHQRPCIPFTSPTSKARGATAWPSKPCDAQKTAMSAACQRGLEFHVMVSCTETGLLYTYGLRKQYPNFHPQVPHSWKNSPAGNTISPGS